MGKGSRYRPINQQRYAKSYERIFGNKKLNNNENLKQELCSAPAKKRVVDLCAEFNKSRGSS